MPVASNTVASTSGRIPRRRTGRAPIVRTCTATVACSPARNAATVRASRLSRGRCSSSSPTVFRPSARDPVGELPRGRRRAARAGARDAASAPARRAARARRSARSMAERAAVRRRRAAHDAAAVATAAGAGVRDRVSSPASQAPIMIALGAAWTSDAARLLGGEQPPVGRLAAVAQLQLDAAVRRMPSISPSAERRILAGEHADQLGRAAPSSPPSASAASTARKRLDAARPRRPPRSPTKPTASPRCEAPLRVVARGRRDRAGAHARERLVSACAFSSTERSGASATAAARPACWLVVGATRHLLVRQLARHARRP